jgi:hypothetical protein
LEVSSFIMTLKWLESALADDLAPISARWRSISSLEPPGGA